VALSASATSGISTSLIGRPFASICAQSDKAKGIYYAFPSLTGVRVSEQLELRWEDIEFDRDTVSIHRVQERDGSTTDMTKTEAGEREIPLSATLRTMLLEWRLCCPRLDGGLYRVFPGQSFRQQCRYRE